MDRELFHWINGWSNGYSPFYDALSEGNKMWPVRIALIVLAIVLIAAGPKTRKAAIFAILGVALANLACDLLKHSIPVNRPCVDLKDVINHGVGFLTSPGTASAHAANTAAIAAAFTYFLRWWGVIPILLSFLTGIARIYVGVHYPSQVLYGWIVGAAVGSLLVVGYRYYESRKQPKPVPEPEA
jgi:undecaprenyl-diphosphatase